LLVIDLHEYEILKKTYIFSQGKYIYRGIEGADSGVLDTFAFLPFGRRGKKKVDDAWR
jgi:hypothetical protein